MFELRGFQVGVAVVLRNLAVLGVLRSPKVSRGSWAAPSLHSTPLRRMNAQVGQRDRINSGGRNAPSVFELVGFDASVFEHPGSEDSVFGAVVVLSFWLWSLCL